MASVADDWNLNFGVVWHLSVLSVLVRGHCDLETSGDGLEIVCCAHVTVLQTWAHWVNVEEWILSVLDVRHRFPVKRLVSLITNCWQI